MDATLEPNPLPTMAPVGLQHLAHSGTNLGPLVADHQHLARLGLAVENSLEGGFLGLEYPRPPGGPPPPPPPT